MTYTRTLETYDYSEDGAYIVMDGVIWNRLQVYAWPAPGQPKSMRPCLHCHGQCCLELFANVHINHSRTIKTYDYSWDSAYIVMDDAIWTRLQTTTWLTSKPATFMVIAQTVLRRHHIKSFATVPRMHPRSIKFYAYGWDGASIVMEDAIGIRL